MDIIENLKTYIAVVETGNFTGASRRLKVAVSVVKKRIDQLEAKVGLQLFERSTRSMTLTDAGRRHLLKSRLAVDQVDQLMVQMALKPNRLEGSLRIKVPTGLLGTLLSEKLNRFQELNSGISLEVMAIDRPVNPIEEGFDVSIILEPMKWPGVADFTLASIKRTLVASPKYLAKRGTPRVPGDLINHDILNYESRGLIWTFQGKTGPLEVGIEPRLNSNNAQHLLKAASVGIGICLIGEHAAMQFVQRGEVVPLLEDYPVSDLWIRMHIPELKLDLNNVQALRTYLMANTSEGR
jgi:DNA-binding transcriptional LysR family regulator